MRKHNRGYTLVEMLMATVLTLMMMSAVVQLFESVGKGVTGSRSLLETNDRLRMAALQLHRDLGGVTVTMQPPRRPESNEGYFEYTEGPVGPVVRPEAIFVDADGGAADTTVTDNDDMLMMTVRSEEPFIGRYAGTSTIQSNCAEVAWFVRGRTLYRRVLLVVPAAVALGGTTAGFYANYDISARAEGGVPVANTLGDLTKPENRFVHQPTHAGGAAFPSHPHFPIDWSTDSTGRTLVNRTWARLGLPTLQETSHSNWTLGMSLSNSSITLTQTGSTASGKYDLWTNPHYWNALDANTGTLTTYSGSRIAEDIVLTNVIGFDVKAWDPGAPTVMDSTGTVALVPGDPGYLAALRSGNTIVCYGAYVDLNYMCPLRGNVGGNPNYTAASGAPTSLFYGAGNAHSGIRGTEPNRIGTSIPSAATLGDVFTRGNFTADDVYLRDAVYDTWSTHYENDGVQQYGTVVDSGTNGLDDSWRDSNGTVQPADGVVDDPNEAETSPPYAVPLRGLQVTIRVYEPSTRQVRQRTIQQDFLAK